MQPLDPIVGGQSLRIPSIHSPNYAAGASGWTINVDGSAEFNNLTIRGTFYGASYVLNGSGAFFYAGTPAAGNLILSIASAGGTDAFGNVYTAGLQVGNQQGAHFGVNTQGSMQITNAAGVSTDFINSADGSIRIGPAAGARFQFAPATDVLDVYDGTNTLVAQWDALNAIVTYLKNANSAFTQVNGNQVRFGTTSPGTMPTPTQVADSAMLTGQPGVIQLESGIIPATTLADQVIISSQTGQDNQGTGGASGVTPQIQISDNNGDSVVDMLLTGNLIKADLTVAAETWQNPAYGTGWSSATVFATLGGNPLQFRLMAEDDLWIFGLAQTVAAGSGATVFTLPVGFRPFGSFIPHAQVSHFTGGAVAVPSEMAVTSAGAVIISAGRAAGDVFSFNCRIPLRNVA